MDKKYYTQAEFARKMGLHKNTVNQWVKNGKVKIKVIGGKKFIVFEEEKE